MAAKANKTQATKASAKAYFEAIEDPARRADCVALDAIMRRATGEKPVMWGSSIVGYGQYHYRYESGREGDMCLVGFSSRKGDISIYVTSGFEGREALLAKLGKHKVAKACLYVKRLADVDAKVLESLLREGAKAMRERHPA